MPNPANVVIDLANTSGNVTGHIGCVTHAGFTQKADVTLKDSNNKVIAQGTFKGEGEGGLPIPLEGGGTTLSFTEASLPLTLSVSASYDPNGTFLPNDPDKVVVTKPVNTSSTETCQIKSEDSYDGDTNDLILTCVALKH